MFANNRGCDGIWLKEMGVGTTLTPECRNCFRRSIVSGRGRDTSPPVFTGPECPEKTDEKYVPPDIVLGGGYTHIYNLNLP